MLKEKEYHLRKEVVKMDLFPASSLNPTQSTNTINSGYVTDLQQTAGMAGAQSIVTRPSSRIAVFDKDDDIMYIIATDMNGNKNVGRYRFYAEEEPKPEDIFASKAEIRELKGEIDNVQQSIRELTDAITNVINAVPTNSDSQSDGGSTGNNKKFIPKSKGEGKPNGSFTNSNGQ